MRKNKILLNEMTWSEAKKAYLKSRIFLLPIGSTEQHGLHLPLGTDYFQAVEIAKIVAKMCRGIVVPGIPFGYSENHMRFKGTISVSGDTLKTLTKDVCKSIFRHGGHKVVLSNSHGGNIPALSLATQELNGEHPHCRVLHLFWIQLVEQYQKVLNILEQEMGTHADEIETSVMLALRGELVQMRKVRKEIPKNLPSSLHTLRTFLSQGTLKLQQLTTTGALGDPTCATKEKGEKLIDLVVKKSLQLIQEGFGGMD